jgi:alkanesulfonate monooxygenase SsuD/methylene tetrahydromethanopterin reductase-like flavin-dependent oxidoreductase (luciferase family)
VRATRSRSPAATGTSSRPKTCGCSRPGSRRPTTAHDPPPIGVTIGTVGVDARFWLDAAERLDAAGYRAIWAWDHFVGKGVPTVPVLEGWTTLSAAAARTRRASLGTFVTNVMNRHPAVVARMAATLQDVAGGRFRLGIGIGGSATEHRMYGIPYPEPAERAEHLREAIAVIRELWSGGPVAYEGRRYRLDGAYAYPQPHPVPPLLVAAQTPAGIRIAAELGDGWAAESPSFERLEARYREELAAYGRRREDQLVVVGFRGGRSGVDSLPGTAWVESPRETFDRWRALGADEVAVTARTPRDIDALVEAARRW